MDKDKKIENIKKIMHMKYLDNDWNSDVVSGAFTSEAIKEFKKIIKNLTIQPEIAPTGRNSLFMYYDNYDRSILAFEVFGDSAEMVYLPYGDPSKAEVSIIDGELDREIEKIVERFYHR